MWSLFSEYRFWSAKTGMELTNLVLYRVTGPLSLHFAFDLSLDLPNHLILAQG